MLNTALKTEIATLTLQDKLEVFEVIRGSVMPPSEHSFTELSERQRQELLRRAELATANPSAGSSWAQVKQRLGA
jgi:putative addiction module component (TIGR02574 family)